MASFLVCLLLSTASAFAPPRSSPLHSHLAATSTPDVVVISPPGGIGEITSLEAAKTGSSVKWFVVSSSASKPLALTSDSLAAIEAAGGSLEFAGADAESLVFADDDSSNSATAAVSTWCSGTKAVLCTYDGAEEEGRRADRSLGDDAGVGAEKAKMIRSGVRVAARQAAGAASSGARKVIALYSDEEMSGGADEMKEDKKGFLGDLFGKGGKGVPETLKEALDGSVNVVRYGELFGAAESSPESSPFIGGPRSSPQIREMYTMRSIRIDPTISVAGNILSGGSQSNRLSVGSSLRRLAMNEVDIPGNIGGIDVALSSYPGTESPTEEEWNAEFSRAVNMLSSPSGGATLFNADFASVPSTTRLAEWIATKWAPAILRSYEIAGTRVGARPVYATHSDNTVEIVWQDLVDFNPVTSGKMIIQVEDNGITAIRGSGDASKGFGSVSMKPLSGEDILVRRLGDAAAQAVEKGLAVKSKEKKAAAKAPVAAAAPVVSAAPKETLQQQGGDAGPRSSGVRRSSERARGKKRKESPPSTGAFE